MIKPIRVIQAMAKLLLFLLLHEEKYKSTLSKITKAAIYIFFVVLGLDLLKIVPTGTISNERQWGIRILSLSIIFFAWLIAFSILSRKYFKKYGKDIHKLTDEELKNILKHIK